MAETTPVSPLLFVVTAAEKKFKFLVGPYFDSPLTEPILSSIFKDIWARTNWRETEFKDCMDLINDAVVEAKPRKDEIFMFPPGHDGTDQPDKKASIYAILGIDSETTRATREEINKSINTSMNIYLVCIRRPQDGSIEWGDRSAHAVLQEHIFGGELDFDFEESIHMHDNFADARQHAWDVMNQEYQSNGDDCACLPFEGTELEKMGLHDTVVGVTYDKPKKVLLELFCVKKVVVTRDKLNYPRIYLEDKKTT